jgi:choline dehydrogenase-like flavoprotein
MNLEAVEHASLLDCEICIIGTGPAGSTIARELSGTGLRILVLESGGLRRQKHADELNEIENVGRPRVLDQWEVRNRILGGSSYTWSGRCAPFDEIDFQRRDWIPCSGWPFDLEHLTPYLERTAPYLGLGTGTGFSDGRFWKLAGRTPPDGDPDPQYLLPFFWQASRDETSRRDFMRFGRHLQRHLGDNVTLFTNATVLRVHTNEAVTAAASVDVAAVSGTTRRITAKAVVLCAGGIENARLLLSSNDRMAAGLGNQNDLVGRFLMDHPRGTVGYFPRMSRRVQKRFGSYKVSSASGDNMYRRGLRLSPEIQQKESLVNCSAFLRDVIAQDDPWEAFTRVLNRSGNVRGNIARIAAGPHFFTRALHNYFITRNSMPHKLERLELVCMCEQVPDPQSRVTLSDKQDRFGMQLSRIDWRTHEMEARTVRRMAQLVAAYFASLGLEVPVLGRWVEEGEGFPEDSFLDVAHPTGTTRMADDARAGVVDRNCEVHGIFGLYIAGSSVFPTAGHCNPTQMIVALALRLADTLKERFRAAAIEASGAETANAGS